MRGGGSSRVSGSGEVITEAVDRSSRLVGLLRRQGTTAVRASSSRLPRIACIASSDGSSAYSLSLVMAYEPTNRGNLVLTISSAGVPAYHPTLKMACSHGFKSLV